MKPIAAEDATSLREIEGMFEGTKESKGRGERVTLSGNFTGDFVF